MLEQQLQQPCGEQNVNAFETDFVALPFEHLLIQSLRHPKISEHDFWQTYNSYILDQIVVSISTIKFYNWNRTDPPEYLAFRSKR